MKYVTEFRDPARIRRAAAELAAVTRGRWNVMEVCGGQTHAIARFSLPELLPEGVRLLHGPGCPVCVTPAESIEFARHIARQPEVTLCTFGDMMRVAGIDGDLFAASAAGGTVRVVLSPLDALQLALAEPERDVVFFAVGFETTIPAVAASIEAAVRLGVSNFSVLCAHVRIPPALELILGAPDNTVDAFLAAGHVCTVEGTHEYPAIARRFGAPIVVTGFEPVDILRGLTRAVRQLEAGIAEVDIDYDRAVRPAGNPLAQQAVRRVFEPFDAPWRGLGIIPQGGLRIRPAWERYDASRRFEAPTVSAPTVSSCRSADVLRGRLLPTDCPQFGTGCTPDHPLGAPMVSSEGACAAYHRYRPAPPSEPPR